LSFSQVVERTSGLKPLYLQVVESMLNEERLLRSVGVPEDGGKRLARAKILDANDGNAVVFPHLIVVALIGKGERQHSLLFEVCFVDTRKAFYQDYLYV
jgi:hypothetical protein